MASASRSLIVVDFTEVTPPALWTCGTPVVRGSESAVDRGVGDDRARRRTEHAEGEPACSQALASDVLIGDRIGSPHHAGPTRSRTREEVDVFPAAQREPMVEPEVALGDESEVDKHVAGERKIELGTVRMARR